MHWNKDNHVKYLILDLDLSGDWQNRYSVEINAFKMSFQFKDKNSFSFIALKSHFTSPSH